MDERMAAALARLRDYLSAHVWLSACALGLGAAISLPAGVLATRSPSVRWALLAGVGLIQTIPSLALAALVFPVMLALSALAQSVFGAGFPALGFAPALAALTLYSMLPMVRNTIVGLDAVPCDVRQAARGVGMTDR